VTKIIYVRKPAADLSYKGMGKVVYALSSLIFFLQCESNDSTRTLYKFIQYTYARLLPFLYSSSSLVFLSSTLFSRAGCLFPAPHSFNNSADFMPPYPSFVCIFYIKATFSDSLFRALINPRHGVETDF
jgi:hypothetical protein